MYDTLFREAIHGVWWKFTDVPGGRAILKNDAYPSKRG
jgi:hypothetical protein